MLQAYFFIKIPKICIYCVKILKICNYMHLYQKWPKYAFAYAHMQMHNYPKPIDDDDFFATAERLSQEEEEVQPTQGFLGLDGPVTPLKIELDRYLSWQSYPCQKWTSWHGGEIINKCYPYCQKLPENTCVSQLHLLQLKGCSQPQERLSHL